MTSGRKQLVSILLFTPGIIFLNPPAVAQACTPTVYLFRHAEDQNGLTDAGNRHAALYWDMLEQYQSIFPTCPVTRVLATYDKKPWGEQGTTNPLNTAQPLADKCCNGNVEMKLVTSSPNPQTFPLFETIAESVNGGLAPAGGGLPHGRLFYALQGTLNSGGSVAIFWTQEGMKDVSKALNVPPIDIAAGTETARLSWPGRLRSSINEFSWTGSSYVKENYSYSPSHPPTLFDIKPVQCFNFNQTTRELDNRYLCQYSGIFDQGVFDPKPPKPPRHPPIPPAVLNMIQGKFCYVLSPISGIEDTYGYCI